MARSTSTPFTSKSATRTATRPAVPRAVKPTRATAPAVPSVPMVSAADEARALRAQQSVATTLDRELRAPDATIEPMKLDADLAHLGGDMARKRVKPARRRQPDEVSVVYRGRRKGMLHDHHISITVPDEDNDDKVAALEEIIPGMDDFTQRAEWHRKAQAQGLEKDPVYVPLHDRLTLSGITYDFTRNEATLVHEDDLDYILAYPAFRLERVDTINEDDAAPLTSRRARRARGA